MCQQVIHQVYHLDYNQEARGLGAATLKRRRVEGSVAERG